MPPPSFSSINDVRRCFEQTELVNAVVNVSSSTELIKSIISISISTYVESRRLLTADNFYLFLSRVQMVARYNEDSLLGQLMQQLVPAMADPIDHAYLREFTFQINELTPTGPNIRECYSFCFRYASKEELEEVVVYDSNVIEYNIRCLFQMLQVVGKFKSDIPVGVMSVSFAFFMTEDTPQTYAPPGTEPYDHTPPPFIGRVLLGKVVTPYHALLVYENVLQ